MSKKAHGNKETKKPKQVRPVASPVAGVVVVPGLPGSRKPQTAKK